jgi:hypothetical protein
MGPASRESRDIIAPMVCDNIKLPTQDAVKEACEYFDADDETKIIEPALTDLFAKYPNNTCEAQVFLKVVTLNNLYATRIPTRAPGSPNVFDVAHCIPRLAVDQALKEGSLQIVNTISTAQFPGKKSINRFSFATKYASWHRQDVYPIWDSKVQNYITCLRNLHRTEWNKFADGFPLSSNNWGYPEFHALIVRLCVHFGLTEVSFKNLDKFFWWHGGGKSDGSSAAAVRN